MVKFSICSKILLFFNLIIFFFSCTKERKNEDSLNFNKVEHYHKEISEEEVFQLYDSQNKNDSLYFQLITGNNPDKLNGNYKQQLKQFGYKKKNLSQTNLDSINIVLNQTKCKGKIAHGCLPIYRDVLFLYNNEELVGISKIALECHQTYIVSTDIRNDNLGLCTKDYDFLNRVLRQIIK